MKRVLAFLFFLVEAAAQPGVVAIRGARVIDGTGAPAQAAIVLIRGSRIEAVGADVAIPPGARIVEAAGETLIPGLFDLHTHLSASAVTGAGADWGKHLKAYLACGVTFVDDFSANGEMFAPMRGLLAAGAVQGPRVNLAARISTPAGHGTEGGWGDFMTLETSTAEQAHAAMRSLLAYKPDVIKVFTDGWRYGTAPNLTSMNLETLSAIVADAHAAGIKVLTHTVTLEGAKIAARAGVDVLAHGIGDAAADQELIDILKAKRTTYVPTLAVYESHQPSRVTPRALAVLDADSREAIARAVRAAARGDEETSTRNLRWHYLLDNVRRLHDAGIPIGVGTDAGMTGTFHGFATLRELELLVEAGLTPLEALTAGASVGARALGVDGERGTIAPGKLADLVLIDGRPDEQIGDIEKTARVFLGGAELDPHALEAAIQSKEPTPLPVHPIPRAIDNMERTDGRTLLNTLRVNSTDAGTDHSRMMFLPVARSGHDHALMVEARMAAKERPYVRLEIPLTPGAVELADVSRYHGVSFEARGEGGFRLLVNSYGVRAGDPFASPFAASAAWRKIKIPFASLRRRADGAAPWNPRDLRALVFEVAGPAGSGAWLEIDNVGLY
jgi:imidazolonepropionase-like amidohydrolase